jgi:Kazal-type serine protease inhibitor domain
MNRSPAIRSAALAAVLAAFASLSPAMACGGMTTAQLTPALPAAERRPTVCTEQYLPVCGRVGDVDKTYSNACFARADGAAVIAQGPCAAPGTIKR